uniref:Ig-like domain-containing protein n=1 Tax=Macrostomum lignano TaxID=282301 RepID=A0A1I8FJ58_9PLAT
MQESLDFPGQQTPAAAASQLRRSSVDSLSRSRRGSSDMAARAWSEDLEAQWTTKVTIACIVHGHPKPEVAWHKDGCHCVISVIDEPADSGVEMLAASAASLDTPAARGCCTADCLVPPELLSLFRDRYCRAGEPVTLECEVAASPAPKVAWSFNGQPIGFLTDRRSPSSKQRPSAPPPAGPSHPAESGRHLPGRAENDAGSATCARYSSLKIPTVVDCSQKVIRASTKLFNRRAEKPSRDWQTNSGLFAGFFCSERLGAAVAAEQPLVEALVEASLRRRCRSGCGFRWLCRRLSAHRSSCSSRISAIFSGQFGRLLSLRSTRRSCSPAAPAVRPASASNGRQSSRARRPNGRGGADFAAPVNRWNIRGHPEPDDDTRDSSCRFSLLSRSPASECFCAAQPAEPPAGAAAGPPVVRSADRCENAPTLIGWRWMTAAADLAS